MKFIIINVGSFPHKPKNRESATRNFINQKRASLIRLTASIVFSRVLNAVRRKYPSPAGPKPEPGVPGHVALLKQRVEEFPR